ncbi:MAG: hypothetical protein ACN6OJ_00270 [Chryseobacterium sp.]|uniref:phosphoribosyltransferase-like protein n=1 Tax=Chryseobacterium sp. TaxID=1871047 RepID=UPI003D12BEE1
MSKNFDKLPLKDRLEEKIRIFLNSIWKEKHEDSLLEKWTNNFETEEEKLHMLFLLSKFMYFGNLEIRELLTSIYRDFFKYPQIHKIRRDDSHTINKTDIEIKFDEVLTKTKFLGVGNPSESGVHLLYYFRQQNNLTKNLFITLSEIFKFTEKSKSSGTGTYLTIEIGLPNIENYIFIDDFCGTGNQAESELKDKLINLKRLKPEVKLYYFMMFGTNVGINKIQNIEYLNPKNCSMEKVFEEVKAIFLLDDSFKTFNANSRFFAQAPEEITQILCKNTNEKYGKPMRFGPLGYDNCELMLSFSHNTPDNSLPIFWNEQKLWKPFFKRYNKI